LVLGLGFEGGDGIGEDVDNSGGGEAGEKIDDESGGDGPAAAGVGVEAVYNSYYSDDEEEKYRKRDSY
jgi:hypothetical protein